MLERKETFVNCIFLYLSKNKQGIHIPKGTQTAIRESRLLSLSDISGWRNEENCVLILKIDKQN